MFKITKNRANDVAALLTNWQQVELAMKSAMEAEGSASRENQKYMDSVKGHLNELKTSWQALSNTFIKSDFLKVIIDGLTIVVELLDGIIDTFGSFGTIGAGFAIFQLFKRGNYFTTLGSILKDSTKSFSNFGAAVKMAGSDLKAFMATPSGVATAIGLITTAISTAISIYNNLEQKERERLQTQLDTANASLESADAFEEAYIKINQFSNKASLTATEEEELAAAIGSANNALGDNAIAFDAATGSAQEYLNKLQAITEEELKQNKSDATKARDAAEGLLQDSSWSGWSGSKVTIDLSGRTAVSEFMEAKDILLSTMADYIDDGTYGEELEPLNWDSNHKDMDAVVDYYYQLVKLTDDLALKNLTNNDIYDDASSIVNDLKANVESYVKAKYQELKAEYQLINGMPTTIEDYNAMRDSILGNIDASEEYKTVIDNMLNADYGKFFEDQAVSAEEASLTIEDKINTIKEASKKSEVGSGKDSSKQIQDFDNWLNGLNENQKNIVYTISVNTDTAKWTLEDWQNALEESQFSFEDLMAEEDTDTEDSFQTKVDKYVEQIDKLKEALNAISSGEFTAADRFELEKLFPQLVGSDNLSEDIKSLITDLTGFYSVVNENGNVTKKATGIMAVFEDAFGRIDSEEDREQLEAFMNTVLELGDVVGNTQFSIDISTETEGMDKLSTAIKESVSATGLSAESVKALQARYKDLEGYDTATLFEETTNGIHLNTDALNDLEKAYEKQAKSKLDTKLNELKSEYDDLTRQIDEYTGNAEDAALLDLYTQRDDVANQINDVATLAAQYDGLTSAYNRWLQAQSGGDERDMYEGVLGGRKELEEEMSRGWLDEGSIKYLELMTGKDLSTEPIEKQIEAYKSLSNTIGDSGHSVWDFFTTDKDGKATSEGIFNFFDTVMAKQKELGENWVQIDKDGNYTFDFGVNGDKAIADALGISEELVQIILRAAKDAGFEINLDSAYTSLADLKTKVEETKKAWDELNQDKGEMALFNINADAGEDGQGIIREIDQVNNRIDELKNKTPVTAEVEAETAYAKASLDYLIQRQIELERPTFMNINVSSVGDEKIQEALTLLKEYQTAVETARKLELSGNVNTEEYTAAKSEVDALATKISELPTEVKTAINLEDGTIESIQDQIAKNKIKIPYTLSNGESTEGESSTVTIEAKLGESFDSVGEYVSALNNHVSTITIDAKKGEGFKTLELEVDAISDIVETITIESTKGELYKLLESEIDSISNTVETITIDAQFGGNFNTIGQSISSISETVETITIEATLGESFNGVATLLSNITNNSPTVTINAQIGESFNGVATLLSNITNNSPTVTINAQLGEGFDGVSTLLSSVTNNSPTITIDAQLGEGFGGIATALSNLTNNSPTVTVNAQLGESFTNISTMFSNLANSSITTTIDAQLGQSFNGVTTLLSNITNNSPTITINTDIDVIDDLKSNIESIESKSINIEATVSGNTEVTALKEAIDSVELKTVNITAEVSGTDEVNDLTEAIDSVYDKTVSVKANVSGIAAVNALKDAIDGLSSKTITITTIYRTIHQSGGNGSGPNGSHWGGGGRVDGTANVNGTTFANGTTGKAFRQGDWGTKDSGVALGGELGVETIVRDGRFFTIGDNGAEFFSYKKGDIIFNHKQTEELFKYGRVTSGGGRGKALVNGTAYAEGTAFSSGSGAGRLTISGAVVSSSSSSNKSAASKKKKKDTDEDDFEETFDWIEVAIKRIEQAIDNLDLKASSIYRSWSERNKNLKDEISEITGEIDIQQRGYERYLKQANSVGLSESWAELVRNGAIDIDTVHDEELAEKIQSYSEWYNKAMDCKYAIDELKESQSELYEQAFDDIVTQYEGFLSVVEHERSMLEEYISQSEASGHIVSTKYYDALINVEKANIDKLEKEKDALLTSLEEAVNSGAISEGSEAWFEMVGQIDEVTLSIQEANTSLIEYNNSIRDIEWSVFDMLQEKISNVTSEADFLINLLSNDKLYDDRGQLTDEGVSTMGLHGMNYNTYMAQADKYAEEMLRISQELANDPYNQDLVERRQELLELQQESILSAESEKQAIVDMVEEGINLELEALSELIDKYTEALDSQKDLYDYQRKVKEQTEEIASLEKQLAAYSGDQSEETKAKLQEIRVSLENAREDLEETEYDKYISDQKQLLDGLYNEYETVLNMRLDNVELLISDMITEININSSIISDTLSEKADSVGYTLSDTMTTVWSSSTENITSVLTTYGQGIQNSILTASTTLGNALSSFGVTVQNMMSLLNTDADSNVQSSTTSSAAYSTQAQSNIYNSPATTSSQSSISKPTSSSKSSSNNNVFYYKKDSYPKNKLDIINSVVDRLKYNNFDSSFSARSDYYSKLGFKGKYTGSEEQNIKMLDYLKAHGYKHGKYRLSRNELAWTQEGRNVEAIIRPSDGAILTPLKSNDSVLKASATANMFNFANDPSGFIKDILNIGDSVSSIPSQSISGNTYDNDFSMQVILPNVTNYEQFKYAMQHDKGFEKMVRAMTVDKMFGGSSLKKYKC